MDDQTLQLWARLSAIAAIGKAQIEANPVPHLDRAARRIIELEEAVDDAIGLLSGLEDMLIVQEIFPDRPPMGIVETCIGRNTRALKILNAARWQPLGKGGR